TLSRAHQLDRLVEPEGHDDQHADREVLIERVDADQKEPVAQHRHDDGAKGSADDRAPAAGQADAADDDGGYAVEIDCGAGLRIGPADPPDEHPSREGHDDAGHDIRRELHPRDPDADQTGGLRVVSDGVDMDAPGGLIQNVTEPEVDRDDHDHSGG